MIPEFPKFKKLEIVDKAEVEKITSNFPPYSDFNFTSLWCWDTDGTIEISELNNNLVVRFLDYLTSKPFYSFIGLQETTKTAQILIQFSDTSGCGNILKLIPEIVSQNLDTNTLAIEEDPDHFDYVYPLEMLIRYNGHRLRAKRNFSNRFKKRYATTVTTIDCKEPLIKEKIMKLFETWTIHKKLQHNDTTNERRALERFMGLHSNSNIIVTGVFDGDDLIAFSSNELQDNEYAIMHFEKADETYIGIYAYLMSENAKILMSRSVRYLNFEQDLGLPGLRFSKKSFHPSCFLKKYRACALSTG